MSTNTAINASVGPDGHTLMEQSKGSKQIKVDFSLGMRAVDINDAPPSRIYTKNYDKVRKDKDDPDTVGPYLGNPLRW
ncbi:MAG: hypothetical protein ABSD12_19745 [Paraburkholderia sp.]